jgi:hypothetical protein
LNAGAALAGMSARTGSLVHAVDRRADVHHPKNAEATNSAFAAGTAEGARCASSTAPRKGRTRCARPPLPEILGSRVAFSIGCRTGRRNAHVIREGHVIRGM